MFWLAGISFAVAVAATIDDLRRRRIANWIPLAGLAGGGLTHTLLRGFPGTLDAFLGGVVGFAVFFVFFLLGGLGGGDVKLMAAFGAILGTRQIVVAAFLTALIGGALAGAYLVFEKARSVRRRGWRGFAESKRKKNLPYAPAISLGALLSYVSEDEFWTNL